MEEIARVEIVPATLRDVSFIAANMCPEDRREIYCQLPAGIDAPAVAQLHMLGDAWCAMVGGQPAEAFGATAATVSVLNLWAFGTHSRRRAIPEVTRFLRALVPQWIERGITRCEARAICGHDLAHRWLRGLGGQEIALPAWGKGGEDFTLFWWTRETWQSFARNPS